MSATADHARFERRSWIIFAAILTTYVAMTTLRRTFNLPEGLAPIWPATATLAAGLLLLDAKRRKALLACTAVIFAVLVSTMNPTTSMRSLIGVPEALLLAWLTRKALGRSPDFTDGRKIALYVGAAAVPSSLAACAAMYLSSQYIGKPATVLAALQWGTAHFLGAALTLPSVVVLVKARKYRPYGKSIFGAIAASVLSMAYAAGFLWALHPLTMLAVFPAALWIAVRYGPIGAAVLAISLIGLSVAHSYVAFTGLVVPVFDSAWVQQWATLLFLTTLPTAGMVCTLRRTRNALNRRTETARAARRRADDAASSKADFLANMSHEIRTPLNGVLGLADAISRTPLQADQRKMLDMIRASGQTLNRLLADSLDLARADSGVLKLEEKPFDLSDAVDAATFVFETLAGDKAVEFKVELQNDCIHAPVGDALRIRQIVANLTGNAVKFTQTGHVHVTASLTPTGPGWSRLTVAIEDTGPGFDEATRKRMFTRFEQADDIARSHGGVGLGLAISQTLARMMGGVIECHSSEGEGSTFIFSVDLPLSDTAARIAAEETAAQPLDVDRPLRILLAEDHPVNQQVVQILLGDRAELTIVENGQEALDALAAGSFDLVLMDTQMPVLDGVAATRELRARERARGALRTPVISLTASAMPQQVMAALEAGADLHLAKPITGASLFGAIAQVIEAEAPGEVLSASGTAA